MSEFENAGQIVTEAGAYISVRSIIDQAVSESGGSTPLLVRFPIAFNTAGILTGITVYTPSAGDLLLWAVVSITTDWDGSTPVLHIGTVTSPDVFGGPVTTTSDQDAGNGTAAPAFASTLPANSFSLLTGSEPVSVAVDDGSGGNPGSTQGQAEIILAILPAP